MNRLLQKILAFSLPIILLSFSAQSFGQTTYTWNQTVTASWATAANWTPTRTSPAATDILQFNNGATISVTNVPVQTIGGLLVSGNTNVTLTAPTAAGNVTINNGVAGADLSVAPGSQLNINESTNIIGLAVATGATGSITGNMTFQGKAHTLTAADAAGITFNSPSVFTQGALCTGNVFGSGTSNSVVFATGTTFAQAAGANPFQKAVPASVVVFQTGSLYKVTATGITPSFSGRTYANFEWAPGSGSQSPSGGNAFVCDNLTVTSGTLNIDMTGTPGHAIKGNVSVATGATLTFTPASAGTINFSGTTAQTISNSGTLTFAANQAVVIDNTASPIPSVTFNQAQTISGSTTVNSGSVLATAGTLTLAGTPAINGTFQINQGGFGTGGTWSYGAGATLVFNNSSGSYGVSGTPAYWPSASGPANVTIQGAGGITMSIARTIPSSGTSGTFQTSAGTLGATNLTFNGTAQINGGGFLTGTPTYGASSTLVYNTTSYTTTTNEFPATGVKNVTITSPSTTNTVTLNADKTITGALAVGNHILNGGKSITAAAITIGTGSMTMGNITTSGAFTCSGASAVTLSGNWAATSFIKSASTVAFNGTGSVNNAASFYNLTNTSGTRSLTQNIDVENSLQVTGGQIGVTGGTGKSLTMSGAASVINIAGGSIYGTDAGAGNDLSLILSGTQTTLSGNATVALDDEKKFFNVTVNNGSTLILSRGILCKYGTFTENGTLQINAGGYVQNDGSYGTNAKLPVYNASTGALVYNNGGPYTAAGEWPASNPPFNTTIQNNSAVVLSGSRILAGTLALTAGTLELASNNLTIGASGAISVSSPDATKMIIASGSGELRKTYTGTGSFTFPIGDNTATSEYSPVTLNFTAGTFSSAYVGVKVANSKHPSNTSPTDYINRYWTVTTTGITSPTCDASFVYADADIAGTETNFYGGRYLSSVWNCMGAVTAATNTISGTVNNFGDFTAGEAGVMGCCINPTSGGTVATTQTICSGGDPAAFTSTALPSGEMGTLEYQWQSSTTNGIAGFADIPGETATTYDAPSGLAATTWYKRLSKVTCMGTWTGAAESNVLQVIVNPTSVAGSIGGAGAVCPGSDVVLTLTGNTGTIQWQSSSDDVSFNDISGETGTTYTVTNVTGTAYYRVVATSGVCSTATSSSVAVTLGNSTTWDGSTWSNGAPTSTSAATISGDYTAAADFNACTLTVDSNAVVNVPPGFDVTLNGALTVSSGSFTLENDANLLQATNATNLGNIIVKRNSSAIKRQDYTLWSSPVASQNLLAFSPFTVVTPTSRFYQYNSSTNQYNSIASPSTTDFNDAQGYLIRVANNHPTFAWIWNGQFSGVPHNGDYSYTMYNGGSGLRFNLVGNPYPSPISAVSFASQNSANITQTLYFWRETNNNTLNNAYCSWSPAGGGNGTFVTNGEAAVVDPNGVIQTGQGFFVEAISAATQVDFNNSMRVANNANQFFRHSMVSTPADIESHRIWLNVTNATGAFCQTAFGYMTGATNNLDLGIDGKYINDGETELYSIIDTERYVIQGRSLPFDASDVVPLGFKATTAGDYSIAIDHLDGLFAGSQDVYLKDNLTGAIHNLKTDAYAFSCDGGTFTSRFEIVYQLPLGVDHPQFNENQVAIYKQGGNFAINSGTTMMSNVKVFDISGRLLVEQNAVNASQTIFNAGQSNEILIVKITSDTNETVTKKVIN